MVGNEDQYCYGTSCFMEQDVLELTRRNILCAVQQLFSSWISESHCCLFLAAAHPAEVTPVHHKLETDSSPSLLLFSLLMKTCTYHCAHWLMMSLRFQQSCSRSCPSMYSWPHSVVDKQVSEISRVYPCHNWAGLWVHTTGHGDLF